MIATKSKTIVIIGGSSGMGLASAQLAIEKGYQVIVASRSQKKLKYAASQIGSERASFKQVDITDETSIENLFSELGKIDHLLISGSEVIFGDAMTMPFSDICQSFNSKVFGPMRIVRSALKHLGDKSSITLFSGSAGSRPEVGTAVISAINSAVEGYSRALALQLAPVRVNTIAPGLIDTPAYADMSDNDKQALFSAFTQNLALKQAGNAVDVAKAALHLIENDYMTGTTLYVDGGHALR